MASYAGFDRYDYPGEAVMNWLMANTNLRWCGYYLGPLPNHPGCSWMTRRATLAKAGWGIAPIYVGRQLQDGTFNAMPAQGASDGDNAAHLMTAEGFDAGSFVYLDIENGAPISAPQAAYVRSWCTAVEAAGYGAGLYSSHTVAATLHNLWPSARIWAFAVATTDSHPVPFPCPELGPAGCGYIGAYSWQLGQNCRLQVPLAHLGVLDADLSSCLVQDPSVPGPPVAVSPDVIVAQKLDLSAVATLATPGPVVVQACQQYWPADKGDCSRFVRDVATACGIFLVGDANEIVEEITSGTNGWRPLKDGVEAAASAAGGKLVVGGLQGSKQASPNPHGHVVIVVPGELDRDLYPTAYWGSLAGTPYPNKTINYAWVPADRDRIIYAEHGIPGAAVS